MTARGVSRRSSVAATIVAVLTCTVACSTTKDAAPPTSSPAPPPAAALAAAAEATLDAGTGRVDISSEMSAGLGADHRVQMVTTSTYTYDLGAHRHGGTIQMRTLVDIDYTFVNDGTTMWVRSPLLSERGIPDGTWVASALDEMRTSDGDQSLLVGPTDILELLKGTPPAAEELGTEVIDGVTTRHLHLVTTVNRQRNDLATDQKQRLARALDSLAGGSRPDVVVDAPISLQAYLDPEGRVRRLDITIETNANLHEANHQIYDFHDLGAPVAIDAPPVGPIVNERDLPRQDQAVPAATTTTTTTR